MRRMLLLLTLAAAFLPVAVVAQVPHITTYGEMYEEPDGRILGDASSVTAYGEESGEMIVAETDGYYRIYDEDSGQLTFHGMINGDGSISKKPPSTPVPRPGLRPGRPGLIGGVCLLLEESAAFRCQARCPYGIKSIDYGTCGFGSKCECMDPPEPPEEPTRSPGTYLAPWHTIPNYNWGGGGDNCGVWQVCDDLDPR